QAEDVIRDHFRSRGLVDVYQRQVKHGAIFYYQFNTATLKSKPQKRLSAKKHPFKKTRYFERDEV
ncbi:hypothetical protein JT092_06170, partial [Helicobacter pylori]|nr:hypothetical protein [Helicobacter pylori]